MKDIINRKLKGDELSFFYNILHQLETDDNLKGYSLKRLPKKLRSVLYPNEGNISKTDELNKVLFKGKGASDFLRHLRNAFAHCNIIYDKNNNTYILYDEYRNQYSMYGCVEKEILEKIITTLINTRKI